MKRIYLSHPYGGKEENRKSAARIAQIYRAIWQAEGKDWQIVDPLAYFDSVAEGLDDDTILRLAVNLMLTCDGILYAPGWKRSRGCRYEHYMAKHEHDRNGATYYQAEIPEELVA